MYMYKSKSLPLNYPRIVPADYLLPEISYSLFSEQSDESMRDSASFSDPSINHLAKMCFQMEQRDALSHCDQILSETQPHCEADSPDHTNSDERQDDSSQDMAVEK